MAKVSSKRATVCDECRICLKTSGKFPIFGDENIPDISMEVSTYGSIQINQEDELPKLICEVCFKLLQGAITFTNSAKHADTILKRRHKRKSETLPKIIKKEIMNTSEFSEEKIYVSVPMLEIVPVELDQCKEGVDIKNEMSDDDFDDDLETVTCEVCNEHFKSQKGYEKHKVTNNHKNKYIQSFVSKRKETKTFTYKRPAYRKDQKCDLCHKYFSKNQIFKHLRIVHKINAIYQTRTKECPKCHKLFRPDYVGRHLKKVHGEDTTLPKEKIECPICKKLLAENYYHIHIKRHDKTAKKYICDQCGKVCSFLSDLTNHRIIHSKDLPYKCEYCPYLGRTRDLLKIHVRTHTGAYPYKCTQCDASCITKSNLNRHMLRHKGPELVCDTCNRGFYTKLELERHISVIHMGIKSHMCNICGAAFGYRNGLMKHERKVHKRAKGSGKPKATYLKLREEGLLQQKVT